MKDILIGENIILRKAKESDYKSMLENVWSDEEIYKWMLFKPTLTESDAIARTKRSIEFQKDHYAYFIALKATDEAIGLCAINEYEPSKFEECGICIGTKYQGQGYGKEVVTLLLGLVYNELNGKFFKYGYFIENKKSQKLAAYFGFEFLNREEIIRPWDGTKKIVEQCILSKEKYQNKK
ncbi:MAG: GNAT family N-acetyltransferase [Bacilli bacterium]|nr:GNAT family N-acetyltransferase [Bacilli bacterium]